MRERRRDQPARSPARSRPAHSPAGGRWRPSPTPSTASRMSAAWRPAGEPRHQRLQEQVRADQAGDRIAGQADARASRRAGRTSAACPGRMAIFQKSSVMPSAVSTSCTRSWSPTEAPPSVTMMSAPAVERFADAAPTSRPCGRRTMPRSSTSAPAARGDRRDAIGVGGDDLVGAGRAARRQQFVAGGDDARPAARLTTGKRRHGWRRRPATAPPRRARGRRSSSISPSLKSSPALADVAAGGDRLEHLDRSRRRCARAFSWMRIVSAPSGTGAPVKMRTASPGADRAGEAPPGRPLSPMTVEPSPARRRCPRRAPHSRPSPKRGRAAACAAPSAARPARGRPPRPAAPSRRRPARRRQAAGAAPRRRQAAPSPSASAGAVVAGLAAASSRPA